VKPNDVNQKVQNPRMTSWNDVVEAAPELAADVRSRFDATGLAMLATLRADGSPRIAGIEPSFWSGEVWMGMMWESRKALDLRRDPRFAIHAATVDKDVKDGDARISGRAIEVEDEATKIGMGKAFHEQTGFDPNDHAPWHLFRVDVTEVHHLGLVGGDTLDIRWWTPGSGLHQVDRK
jgi:hypothetical protein